MIGIRFSRLIKGIDHGCQGLALSLRAIVSTRLNILGASQKQD
jgi:hypothetical protein